MHDNTSSSFLGRPLNRYQALLHPDLIADFSREFEAIPQLPQRGPQENALQFLSEKMSQLAEGSPALFTAPTDGDRLRALSFCLDRMKEQLSELHISGDCESFTCLMHVIPRLGEDLVRAKALSVAHLWIHRLSPALRGDMLSLRPLQLMARRIFESPPDDVWSSVASFLILVACEGPDALATSLGLMLERYRQHDALLFFKSHCLEAAKTDPLVFAALLPFIDTWMAEDSAYVKIRLAEVLSRQPDADRLDRLMIDADPQVALAATLEMLDLHLKRGWGSTASFNCLLDGLSRRGIAYVLHLSTLHIKELIQAAVLAPGAADELELIALHTPSLIDFFQFQRQSAPDRIRRGATICLRWLEVASEARLCALMQTLASRLAGPEARVVWQLKNPEVDVLTCLTLLAAQDLGLEVAQKRDRWTLYRGYQFAWSAWRLVHEWKNRSSIKRQGHAHWVSRNLRTLLKIPSSRVCELVATTIPGEPLYIEEADGWRPWIPLACDFYRLLRFFRSQTLTILTAEGLTRVKSPARFLGRCRAWLRLTFHYESYASLRNWHAQAPFQPHSYIAGMRQLGFDIEFKTLSPLLRGDDDSVVQHFSSGSLS